MNQQPLIRIFSVDDHPMMIEGIAALINNQPDMFLIAEASSGREGLELYRKHQPDITLMDLRLPDMSGIDLMASILKEFPEAKIIILTMSKGDAEIRRALEAGAHAYLLKTMPPKEFIKIIRQVHEGKKHVPAEIAAQLAEHLGDEILTSREQEILHLVSGGNRNQDIAKELSISEEMVKVHIRHVIEKLGAADRTEAVVIAVKRGIIHL